MIWLADLNPRWLRAVADPLSHGYGVEFDCPCGGAVDGCPQRIWLMFANPIAGPQSRLGKRKTRWLALWAAWTAYVEAACRTGERPEWRE